MTQLGDNRFYTGDKLFPIAISTNGTEFQIVLMESGAIKVICNANNKNLFIKHSSGNSVEIIAQ